LTLKRANNLRFLLWISFFSFIVLGLPDGTLGVAWPSIRDTFGLPLDALGVLFLFFTSGYLASSFASGKLISLLGINNFLLVSSLLMGSGLLGYVLAPAWWVMVAAALVFGFGGGGIDAGVNNYVATHHSAQQVIWLHASYGLGATIGPLIVTGILEQNLSWRWSFFVISSAAFAMAVIFGLTRSRWRELELEDDAENAANNHHSASYRDTLRLPVVWFSIMLFFLYTGVEVTAGQWSFTMFTEGRGLDPAVVGVWISIYWGSLTFGRFLVGVIANWIGVNLLLRSSMLSTIIGALLIWLDLADALSFFGLALMGFSLASIFPTMIAATLKRMERGHATNTIGFEVGAAGIGGAILPALAGVLARNINLEVIGAFLFVNAVFMFSLHELIVFRTTIQR
jgi:fucose permease